MAATVAETSHAPFPNARSVAPAKRGGRPSSDESMDREGVKYSSALDPSNRNRSVNCSRSRGDRIASHDAVDSEIALVAALANADVVVDVDVDVDVDASS
jgi:hypothetical protein